MLLGRASECAALDELLDVVRGGHSRVLVLRGEPGVGKTALLEHVVDAASGFRITRAFGVEAEMELPFAALQTLCAPLLDRLDRLPEPQRAAIGTAFGLSSGAPPEQLLVGLAALRPAGGFLVGTAAAVRDRRIRSLRSARLGGALQPGH